MNAHHLSLIRLREPPLSGHLHLRRFLCSSLQPLKPRTLFELSCEFRSVTTRRYHLNLGRSDNCCRPNRAMAHHRPLTYHPSARAYTGGDDRDYSPPNDDSRSGRGDKKPRKRNSVAVRIFRSANERVLAKLNANSWIKCARCRKRKIKCTGDLHDGNGCGACQAAGANHTSCFYLRVNFTPDHSESCALTHVTGKLPSTGRISSAIFTRFRMALLSPPRCGISFSYSPHHE